MSVMSHRALPAAAQGWRRLVGRTLALTLALCLPGAPLWAQSHGVPPELLSHNRRLEGDRLQICTDVSSRTTGFDRAVGQALADALFLEPVFIAGFGGFPTSGDGFIDELQIAMTNRCDLLLGMTVTEDSPFPEWAALSRPYVSLPYLLVVADDYKSLSDIPLERKLGTAMSSMGERVFITWNQQRPAARRYKRLPYADMNLMATRLIDGSIAAMLIWSPVFSDLKKSRSDLEDVKLIPLAPVPDMVTRVGALMKSGDSYLRTQIDQAIDSLVEDGTIAAILAEFDYDGTPGDARGKQ